MGRESIIGVISRIPLTRKEPPQIAAHLMACFEGQSEVSVEELATIFNERRESKKHALVQVEWLRLWMKKYPDSYTETLKSHILMIRDFELRIFFSDVCHPLDWFFGTGLPAAQRKAHWQELKGELGFAEALDPMLPMLINWERISTEHPFYISLSTHALEFLPFFLDLPDFGKLSDVLEPLWEEIQSSFFREIIQNGKAPQGWLETIGSSLVESSKPSIRTVCLLLAYPLEELEPYLHGLLERWVPYFLFKCLLGFPGFGQIGSIPNLEERRHLLQVFDSNTSWKASRGLRSALLDNEAVDWKFCQEEAKSLTCWEFYTFAAYRQFFDPHFGREIDPEDRILPKFGLCPLLPEAWRVLQRLPTGDKRNDIFAGFVNQVRPELLVGEEFQVMAEWIAAGQWAEAVSRERLNQFISAVLKRWKDFRTEDRARVALALLRIEHGSDERLVLMLEQAIGEMEDPAINVVRQLIAEGSPTLCRLPERFEGWEKILLFLCQHRLFADQVQTSILAQRFIEFNLNEFFLSIGDDDIAIVFAALWDHAPLSDWLKLVGAQDLDVRFLLAQGFAHAASWDAAAGLAFLRWDNDADVRKEVEKVLNEDTPYCFPVNRLMADDGETPLLRHLVMEGERLLAWGQALGETLLGRSVEIRFFAAGLGQTPLSRPPEKVEMEINPMAFFRGHVDGESIVKGLILHEIGHHYWDLNQTGARAMRGIAKSRNVKEIFEILIDERLERAMRTVVPEANPWFDRLASYAFAQETHELPLAALAKALEIDDEDEVIRRIRAGELPGRLVERSDPAKVALKPVGFFNLPFTEFALMGFLNGLCGPMSLDTFADPRVRRALACVPSNLRVLPHSEVLKVALAVGEALGVDTTSESASPSDCLNSLKEKLGELKDLLQQLLDRLGSFSREAMKGMVSESVREAKSTSALISGEKFPTAQLPRMCPERLERSIPPEKRSQRLAPPRRRARNSTMKETGQGFNAGDGSDFERLEKEKWLQPAPAAHKRLFQSIAPHIRRMRGFLQTLVEAEREAPASMRGTRIDLAAARQAAVLPQTRLLVGRERSPQAGYYIGILIDNSISMHGEQSEKAKAFGMLIAEAAKGIRGVEGHVNAFDDDTFIRLGDFRSHSIAALSVSGGNNDAGGIAAAAELALASRKAHRIIVMINDDSPTGSTAAALGNLVQTLTRRHGLILAQVAVDKLQTGAFPHFVDFSSMEFDEAVGAFGALLRRLMTGRGER